MATDGLWDVMSDDAAVKLACAAARRVHERASVHEHSPAGGAGGGGSGVGGGTSAGGASASTGGGGAPPNRALMQAAADASAQALVDRAGALGSLDNVLVLCAWIEWVDGDGGAEVSSPLLRPR